MKQSARPLFMRIAASAVVLTMSAQAAQADWITEKLSETCSGTAFMGKQATDVRQQVEDYIGRSEAAIQPPAPVGDLGCLQDLMSGVNLDFFSGMLPDVQSMFGNAFSGVAMGPGGVEAMICSFAQQKWNELTGKLRESLQSATSGLQPPDFTSNFGMGNIPGGGSGGNTSSPIEVDLGLPETGTGGNQNGGTTPGVTSPFDEYGNPVFPSSGGGLAENPFGSNSDARNQALDVWRNMFRTPGDEGDRH